MAAALRPPGLVKGKDNALQASMGVGLDINLFETVNNGRARDRGPIWALQEWMLSQRDEWYDDPLRFRALVRSTLLAKAVDDITDGRTPSDVAVGLAWLLAQDPARPPAMAYGDGPEDTLGEQKMKAYIGTDEQWRGLARWAMALGCAVPTRSQSREHLLPDPTQAILEELPVIQPTGMVATDFYDALIRSLPVLDGGKISEYMRAEKAESADPRGDAMIGPAFSFALKRLDDRHIIRLVTESDATYRVNCTLHGEGWTFDRVTLMNEGSDD